MSVARKGRLVGIVSDGGLRKASLLGTPSSEGSFASEHSVASCRSAIAFWLRLHLQLPRDAFVQQALCRKRVEEKLHSAVSNNQQCPSTSER